MADGSEWRVGIIGAMQVEVEDLIAELDGAESLDIGPAEAWLGALAGTPVAIVQSGVGKAAAAAVTQALISAVPLYALVNTGVAGALAPNLEVGDVVVSTFATYHDADATALKVYPRCVIPGFPRRFKANQDLVAIFSQVAVPDSGKVVKAGIASGDQFVNDPAERRRIRNLTSAACCEMEGTAVAQVATMNDLPFVICRAISDTAAGTSPIAYARFEPVAAKAMAARVVAALPYLRRQ